MSSDLGSAVRRAVRRNDEGSDELFEAVAAFLASARLDMVRDSDGVAREILRAPLDRWLWLRDPGKGAYLRLLRSLLAAHPRLARRIAGPGPLRGAVWILRRWDGWPANAVATVLLLLHLPLAVAHHQRENHRRRIVSESVRPR